MPFLAVLEHFDPKSAQKWPNWFKYVSSKWISLIWPYFYGKMLKKCKKNPNILNVGRVFPVSKVFTAQILSVSQNQAVLFF